MSAPSPKSLPLAAAIVLAAGVAHADSSNAVAAPSLSTSGGKLAIVDVDTVSDNLYVINTSSLTNKARVRQRGTNMAGVVLTQTGQLNSADISVSGRKTFVLSPTPSRIGTRTTVGTCACTNAPLTTSIATSRIDSV